MSDESKEIVAALDNLPMEDLSDMSGEYFDPRGDAERMPSFDGRFRVVKILHVVKILNDAYKFSFQDELFDKINGVIVEFHLTKTWYEVPYERSGGGNRPDCYSNDSIVPLPDSPKKQAEKCALCPRNQSKPDPDREGKKMKECRDTITLYIWNPRHDRPTLMRISTMNRKRVSDFVKMLAEKGIAKELITCEFSLFKDTQTASVPFAGIKITPKATVPQMLGWFKEEGNRDAALQNFSEKELENLTPKMIVQKIAEFKAANAELFETQGVIAGAEAEKPESEPQDQPQAQKGPEAKPAKEPKESLVSPPTGENAEPPF